MIYRVVLRVSYMEKWFDFDDVITASKFANMILEHQVRKVDEDLDTEITIKIIVKEEK